MVLPAMVYKSDPRETMAHFRAVAAASDLPIMVYNNPVSYGVDITPEMFAELADEPKLVAIKESSENVRRITDLKNACGDRYIAVLRRRRPGAGEPAPGRDGLGVGAGQRLPRREPPALGPGHRRPLGRGASRSIAGTRRCLHLDTHVKLVQYIKLAVQECGLGSEMVRAPRLPLVGRGARADPGDHPPRDRDAAEDWPGSSDSTRVDLVQQVNRGSTMLEATCSVCSVIDSHTGGEPTRVVDRGRARPGRRDRWPSAWRVFRDRHDAFRSAVVNEPRGSDVMVGRPALRAGRSGVRGRRDLLQQRRLPRHVRPRHDRRGRDAGPPGPDRRRERTGSRRRSASSRSRSTTRNHRVDRERPSYRLGQGR